MSRLSPPRWALLAARAWVILVAALLAWAVAPAALGWQPIAVLTGSMAPAVTPGDIAVVEPHPAQVNPNDIVLVRVPGIRTGQLLHRLVKVNPDGTMTTKGDANAAADSTPVPADAFLGKVRYVVPHAARFAMLANGPTPLDLGWTAVTVVALLISSLDPRAHGRRRAPQPLIPA